MRKFKPYILPVLILVIGFIFLYFLFRYLDFNENKDKSLALLLSAVGLIFGFFQVFLNISMQGVRNKVQLRHAEYKELGKVLNGISELLNENMMKELNIHGLANSLLNRINEFKGFIENNGNYLFPGIHNNKVAKETRDELHAIFARTDRFRKELETSQDKDMERMIFEMNWHNDVRENLKQFNDLKSKLMKEVQTYFK